MMFFFAITKNKLDSTFGNYDVKESKIFSPFETIMVTDGFLGKYIFETNNHSIVEAIDTPSCNSKDVIFSQAKFNEIDKSIQVSRPNVAGRPIYYTLTSDNNFYCSTHISLFREIGISIEENIEVLPEFFIYRYIIPPKTLYKNIMQLGAGNVLNIRILNGRCKVDIDNFDVPLPDPHKNNINDISRHTITFLQDTIQALSPNKQKLSFLLSGGLDSSILFRICKNKFGLTDTFSTGYPFEAPENNREKEYAFSAAEMFGSKHQYYLASTEDYLRGLLEAIYIAEEPLHHLQSVMFHLLFQSGLENEKNIVISGQGADGVFGLGLHNDLYHYQKPFYRLIAKYPLLNIFDLVSRIVGKGKETLKLIRKYNAGPHLLSDADHILWTLGMYGSTEWVCDYFCVKKQNIIGGRYNSLKLYKNRSPYDLISILDFTGDVFITQNIWSKLGEKQNKILYFPYNNKKLLNYVYSIPWEIKLKYPKNILRAVAIRLQVPESIITRPKGSFGINANRWAKKGTALDPLISLVKNVFDIKIIKEMQSSDSSKAMTFWNIINYAIWKRLLINNEPFEVLLDELYEEIERNER